MPLKSNLSEIAGHLHTVIREAEVAAAELVVQSAKERVPVASGRLRDAIHTEQRPEGVWVRAGDNKAWYGHIVEHGSVNQPSHPFLVPALEDNRAEIEAIFAAAIRRAI